MTATDAMDGVDFLIPKSIHDRHKAALRESRMDLSALIDVLPSTSPSPDGELPAGWSDADPAACKAWIARAIRALPTQCDMEANDGVD